VAIVFENFILVLTLSFNGH